MKEGSGGAKSSRRPQRASPTHHREQRIALEGAALVKRCFALRPCAEADLTGGAKHSLQALSRRIDSATTSHSPTSPKKRSLGRTLLRWKHQVAAWHEAHVSNGPTEAANNLVKRVKRVAFGFTNFRNYRVRSLLYAGEPDWSLLSTLIPR